MKSIIQKPIIAIILATVSSSIVAYISYVLRDDKLEFPYYGLIFGVVTSLYILTYLIYSGRSKISTFKSLFIWIFASGVSWAAAYYSGFAMEIALQSTNIYAYLMDNFVGNLFQGVFIWTLVGGFVGASIIHLTLVVISKRKYDFKYLLKFSGTASIAAVVSVPFIDSFGYEIGDTIFIVHFCWQATVMYLVHRYLIGKTLY